MIRKIHSLLTREDIIMLNKKQVNIVKRMLCSFMNDPALHKSVEHLHPISLNHMNTINLVLCTICLLYCLLHVFWWINKLARQTIIGITVKTLRNPESELPLVGSSPDEHSGAEGASTRLLGLETTHSSPLHLLLPSQLRGPLWRQKKLLWEEYQNML